MLQQRQLLSQRLWSWSLDTFHKGHEVTELVFQILLINHMQNRFYFSKKRRGFMTFWIHLQDSLLTLAACFSEPFAYLVAAKCVDPSLIIT